MEQIRVGSNCIVICYDTYPISEATSSIPDLDKCI